jgi:hypothetical protein
MYDDGYNGTCAAGIIVDGAVYRLEGEPPTPNVVVGGYGPHKDV